MHNSKQGTTADSSEAAEKGSNNKGEIYSEEALEEYNGFCETCFDEIERAERDEEEEGAVEDARERTGVPVCTK